MRTTRSEGPRVKIIVASLCVAPLLVGAIVTVASGGAGASSPPPAGRRVTSASGAGLNSGAFDELTMVVPQHPGVDGRIGSDGPARADVAVQGVTDGRSVVRPGRPGAVNGIPSGIFPAYRRATANLAVVRPECGLTWPLLAAIGKVESAHAGGGRVDVVGTTRGRIFGPVLNGKNGTAKIKDTDEGRFDRDPVWDRPVGPMQIIPGVWKQFGADGNGDGFRNPNNAYDAVTTVAVVLCAEGGDLRRPRDLVESLLRYQHSKDFVATVLLWMRVYSHSAVLVPNAKGDLSRPKTAGNAQRTVDPRTVPDPTEGTGPKSDASVKPTPRSTPTPKGPADEPTVADPSQVATDEPSTPTTPDDEPSPTPTPTPEPSPTPTEPPTTEPTTTPTSPTPSAQDPTPCPSEPDTEPSPCAQSATSGAG
jgi:hypothetical protein